MQRYFRGSKLDYPNNETSKASKKYVKAMKPLPVCLFLPPSFFPFSQPLPLFFSPPSSPNSCNPCLVTYKPPLIPLPSTRTSSPHPPTSTSNSSPSSARSSSTTPTSASPPRKPSSTNGSRRASRTMAPRRPSSGGREPRLWHRSRRRRSVRGKSGRDRMLLSHGP